MYKLDIWGDDEQEPYVLIAIHSSAAAYRVAYMVNRFLGYSFTREDHDQDVVLPDYTARFPVFKYVDTHDNTISYLVANKHWAQLKQPNNTIGLFANNEPELITTILVKEYQKVDYLLKIEQDQYHVAVQYILDQLIKIPVVISAYPVDRHQIKQQDYLIFE